MGEPTYFDGPDYPDGTDAEGFPDGDQRFGLIKPTKEEVESGIEEARGYNFMLNPPAAIFRKKYIVMAKAYLALREEKDELEWKAKSLCVELGNAFMEKTKFQADNEALREKLAQVEQASQRIIGNMIGEQQHGTD